MKDKSEVINELDKVTVNIEDILKDINVAITFGGTVSTKKQQIQSIGVDVKAVGAHIKDLKEQIINLEQEEASKQEET